MKLIFRAFKAIDQRDLCERYLNGHIQVLVNYGITNITTNNKEWMDWDFVYCVIAEKEDGTVVGGVRTQIADGTHPLPVEKAIGKMDPMIHDIVKKYQPDGVGELCALWNAKEVAGIGLSIMLVRAGIAMLNQVKCNTLMGICADYTLKMFRKDALERHNEKRGKHCSPNLALDDNLNKVSQDLADKMARDDVMPPVYEETGMQIVFYGKADAARSCK